MSSPETTPRRVQRSRAKGWRMPEGAVYVGRPTRWGNPFALAWGDEPWSRPLAVQAYRDWLAHPDRFETVRRPPSLDEIQVALRGHDLACWCPPDQPCHADVLLEVANA